MEALLVVEFLMPTKLLHATSDPTSIFVSEDLSKFFDCINVGQACAVLSHLGAPATLIDLVRSFYSASRRIFVDRGICSAQWRTATSGLMQGCPLSPLIAAAIMRVWAGFVQVDPSIKALAYLDDRTFWCSHAPSEDSSVDPGQIVVNALQGAKHRSNFFDSTFGFSCSADKCHIAGKTGPQATSLSEIFGYRLSPTLNVLGAQHCIGNPHATAACPAAVRKCELRLKFLELGSHPPKISWHFDSYHRFADLHMVCCHLPVWANLCWIIFVLLLTKPSLGGS